MFKIADAEGDTIALSDASDMLKRPGVSVLVTNVANNTDSGADEVAEVWLPSDVARHLAKGLVAYADMAEAQAEAHVPPLPPIPSVPV